VVIAGIDQPKDGKSGGDTIPAVQGNYSELKIVKPTPNAVCRLTTPANFRA